MRVIGYRSKKPYKMILASFVYTLILIMLTIVIVALASPSPDSDADTVISNETSVSDAISILDKHLDMSTFAFRSDYNSVIKELTSNSKFILPELDDSDGKSDFAASNWGEFILRYEDGYMSRVILKAKPQTTNEGTVFVQMMTAVVSSLEGVTIDKSTQILANQLFITEVTGDYQSHSYRNNGHLYQLSRDEAGQWTLFVMRDNS